MAEPSRATGKLKPLLALLRQAVALRWIRRARRMAGLGAAALFLGLFIKLSAELREDPEIEALDLGILAYIASHLRHERLNGMAVDITALGSAALLTLFTALGILLLALKRDWRALRYLTVGAAGAGICSLLMKQLFLRDRPTHVPRLVEVAGYSYPSGHSLGATAFYLLAAFLVCRAYDTLAARLIVIGAALAIIGLVCLSRLYLGVHFPSDVLSGFFLGSAWALLLTALFSLRAARKSQPGP